MSSIYTIEKQMIELSRVNITDKLAFSNVITGMIETAKRPRNLLELEDQFEEYVIICGDIYVNDRTYSFFEEIPNRHKARLFHEVKIGFEIKVEFYREHVLLSGKHFNDIIETIKKTQTQIDNTITWINSFPKDQSGYLTPPAKSTYNVPFGSNHKQVTRTATTTQILKKISETEWLWIVEAAVSNDTN